MEDVVVKFGLDYRLLLIQMFNFGLLLLILWFFLYRPVIALLEERRKKIEKGVRDSEEAGVRLNEINKSKDSIISHASHEADQIMEKARQNGKEKESELLATAQDKGTRILKDAELRAEEAKKRALEESKTEIAKMAVLGAEKILQKNKV